MCTKVSAFVNKVYSKNLTKMQINICVGRKSMLQAEMEVDGIKQEHLWEMEKCNENDSNCFRLLNTVRFSA